MKKRATPELQARLATFARQYSRKAQKGQEPNDRRYDIKLENLMKRLPPEELSSLLNEDDAEGRKQSAESESDMQHVKRRKPGAV